MSDQAVLLEAGDKFGLGGNFVAQNSDTTTDQEWARMLNSNGKWLKWSNEFNAITNVTVVYKYNATTGLYSALPLLGAVSNSIIITGIDIESVHDDWPTITITGHNHTANAHENDRNTWDLSSFLTLATGAFGAYDWAGLAADEVCAQRSTISASVNHLDENCDHEHWVGQNIQAQLTATVEYIGPITAPSIENWNVSSWHNGDSNEAFDKSSITIERPLDGTISEEV